MLGGRFRSGGDDGGGGGPAAGGARPPHDLRRHPRRAGDLLPGGGGRDPRPDRPQRRRQDDSLQHDHGGAQANQRGDLVQGREHHARAHPRAGQARYRAHLSGTAALRRDVGRRQHPRRHGARRHLEAHLGRRRPCGRGRDRPQRRLLREADRCPTERARHGRPAPAGDGAQRRRLAQAAAPRRGLCRPYARARSAIFPSCWWKRNARTGSPTLS